MREGGHSITQVLLTQSATDNKVPLVPVESK
jgi:hypothetical protein